MEPALRSMSASLSPQTSDALKPCLYASRIIAQSRVERFFAALSRASISWGLRITIRPCLVRIGRPFEIEIGITAGVAISSFLWFWDLNCRVVQLRRGIV